MASEARAMIGVMKTLFWLLLIVSPVAYSSIDRLDEEQAKLASRYLELNQQLPDLQNLRQSLAGKDRELVRNSLKDIRAFFKQYDDFNLRKIEYIFATIVERARSEARASGKLSKKANKYLQQLETAYANYLKSVSFFGTERDMERLNYGQDVLPAYGNFIKELRKERGEKPWRNFGSAKIVPFVDTVPDFLKVSPKFMKMLWAAYFRGNTGKTDSAPIPEALAEAQRKLVSMRKIETKWEGLQNLESLEHDGKTLNMFLINHANSFMDTSAQQAFPVKGMSSMGNVDVFFPAFLARRMVKSDHMVTVGHGDTTQKTIDLVKRKQLNRFFLAIEGITGVGLYEMRPIMPLFEFAVYDSIERGLNLKLYPVAFPDHFRLMNDWRSPIEGPGVARGVVFPPISSEMCLNLKSMTGKDDAISQVIRWTWFSALNNSQEEVLSMPYPTEIMNRIERMVWGQD